MAARESAAVQAAASDVVLHGLTRADAAKKHGVALSSITRALQRRKMPPLPPGRRVQRVELPLPEPYHYGDGTPLETGKP